MIIQRTQQNFCRHQISGLTLIEVVAALFLSTLLLISLQEVIVGFKKQSAVINNIQKPEAWKRRLRNRLEWDIKNSRQIQISENGLVLVGYASRDPSGSPVHYNSKIRYRIIDNHLIRISQVEYRLDESILQRQELMAVGITKILIGRIEDTVQDLLIPVPEQEKLHPLANNHKVFILNESELISEFLILR